MSAELQFYLSAIFAVIVYLFLPLAAFYYRNH